MEADFSGYATRNGIECSDGRTILADAFKHNDQTQVPLVWQHKHDDPTNILGHALLENRSDGVYARAFFNNTEKAQTAKEAVRHGDIKALSIYANGLKQRGGNVLHGNIREVSIVVSGANPGAFIDNISLKHGDGSYETLEEEAIIYTGLTLEHAEEKGATMADTATNDKTVKEVFDSMTDEQKNVAYFLIGEAAAGKGGDTAKHSDEDDVDEDLDDVEHGEDGDQTIDDILGTLNADQKAVVHFMLGEALKGADSTANLTHSQEGSTMTNVFEKSAEVKNDSILSHADVQNVIKAATKGGGAASFKEVLEEHLEHAGTFGINDIDIMFPDAKTVAGGIELIARQAEWVPQVLAATKHSPFAKIKSIVADLTPEAARAKGYVKGTMKKEEVVGLLKRTTGPTTIYKKQKLDRDDIIDITDFDIVAWLKWEIRFMLNEELARAILIGDGRSNSDDDKIKDPGASNSGDGIRSIMTDNDLYAHKVNLAANVSSSVLIDEVTRARTFYRGSGSPTFYTTDKTVTDLMLLKDKMGRRLYATEAELAAALRVKDIVTVEVFEDVPTLLGIMVNLIDYNIGANKGGELSFFEDFDIDFNQNKYLLETRVSGALTKPKSAIVIRRALGTLATAAAPSFDGPSNTLTIPSSAGVDYLVDDVVTAAGDVVITKDVEVSAAAKDGFYIAPGATIDWAYTYTA